MGGLRTHGTVTKGRPTQPAVRSTYRGGRRQNRRAALAGRARRPGQPLGWPGSGGWRPRPAGRWRPPARCRSSRRANVAVRFAPAPVTSSVRVRTADSSRRSSGVSRSSIWRLSRVSSPDSGRSSVANVPRAARGRGVDGLHELAVGPHQPVVQGLVVGDVAVLAALHAAGHGHTGSEQHEQGRQPHRGWRVVTTESARAWWADRPARPARRRRTPRCWSPRRGPAARRPPGPAPPGSTARELTRLVCRWIPRRYISASGTGVSSWK